MTERQEWGSDFVADFLASEFEFVSFTPGSSFRGIEESIVNYNDNDPRVIEVPHECLSVSVAHGYAKAAGEPGACLMHNVVGTLHAAMGLFNAYCDRVPMLALAGAGPIRKHRRRPYFDWLHATLDQGDLVRGYVTYDDTPVDMADVPDSLVRAMRHARTPPEGPAYVALDHDVQENELDEPIPVPDPDDYGPPTRPAPDPDAVERAADILLAADLPVILVDRMGTSPAAVDALCDLAETLGAGVVHSHRVGTPHRYNFPNTHPLDVAGTGIIEEADAVLALDVFSPDYTLTAVDSATHEGRDLLPEGAAFVEVGTDGFRSSGLAGDQFGLRETDLSVGADSRLFADALADALRERLDGADRRRRDERRETLADMHDEQREVWRQEAEDAWEETPISLPRLAGEVWDLIEGADWTLVNGTLRGWAYRLWEIDEFDQFVGGYSGGGGIGHGIGHAIGGALAVEGERVPVNLQPDGDLMFYPGGLWTMARYDLPVLTVMHNNRSLYNSTNHRMELAAHRGRDASLDRALIGTGFDDPVPDYAAMAESMGVAGYGPVEDPDDLRPVLEAAWADVRDGEPALVDVICQPR